MTIQKKRKMFNKKEVPKKDHVFDLSGIKHDLSIKDRRIRPNMAKGAEKIATYLEDFLKSDFVMQNIKSLRKEIGIPAEGFPMKDPFIDNAYSAYINSEKYTAKILLSFQKIKDFIPELRMSELYDVLYLYLLFDASEARILKPFFYWNNLCKIADAKEEWESCIEENYFHIDKLLDMIEHENGTHPIHLRINPYASQNDVTDFIKKHWDIIEDRQKRHRISHIKLGKTRSRNPEIQKRNQFIYTHRNLPRKELSELVAKEFSKEISNTIDQGSVGKIISIKKKKEIKN